MKFIYIDESGARGHHQSDVFVMCGLMVDAYKLRKQTELLDRKFKYLFEKYPGTMSDLKTTRFINGKGAWKAVDMQERQNLLKDICDLAVNNVGKTFGVSLSFANFDAAVNGGYNQPFDKNYWLASAMFISALIQKKMQKVDKNKGLTVVIMDDNKYQISKLSNALYDKDPWYDGLYKVQGKRRGKTMWLPRTQGNRFDHIVNTAFAIKSDHSSLVQVADALAYVYRRHLELTVPNEQEAWAGERAYISGLVALIEPHREKIGRCPDEPCWRFYRAAKHPEWKL